MRRFTAKAAAEIEQAGTNNHAIARQLSQTGGRDTAAWAKLLNRAIPPKCYQEIHNLSEFLRGKKLTRIREADADQIAHVLGYGSYTTLGDPKKNVTQLLLTCSPFNWIVSVGKVTRIFEERRVGGVGKVPSGEEGERSIRRNGALRLAQLTLPAERYEQQALTLREKLGAGRLPIASVSQALAQLGIALIQLDPTSVFPTKKPALAACAGWIQRSPSGFVLLAPNFSSRDGFAKRESLALAWAHLMLTPRPGFALAKEETAARLARALLVPVNAKIPFSQLTEKNTPQERAALFRDTCLVYGVSATWLTARLRDWGLQDSYASEDVRKAKERLLKATPLRCAYAEADTIPPCVRVSAT